MAGTQFVAISSAVAHRFAAPGKWAPIENDTTLSYWGAAIAFSDLATLRAIRANLRHSTPGTDLFSIILYLMFYIDIRL